MTVYVCGPDFENILCGIYDGFMEGKGHENLRLELRGEFQELELFAEYVEVATVPEKVERVIRSIGTKLSNAVYEQIYIASLSQDGNRPDRMYRFLVEAFRYGPGVLDMVQLPPVYEMFCISRNVYNENHLLTQFIRFSQTPQGALVSRIGPKNDVLALLAPHFADRLPEENWVIFDENRVKAAVHPRGKAWFLTDMPLENEGVPDAGPGWVKGWLKEQTDEEIYKNLWYTFFDSVAIQERANYKCQRNHLPLRFRPYMTEFNR